MVAILTYVTIQIMKNSHILKWVLIVSIVIVLNLFFSVGLRLVYPGPEYEQYCPVQLNYQEPKDSQACVALGGAWNGPTMVDASVTPKPQGYCDLTYTCRMSYDKTREIYNRNVFVIMVILGLASIIIGFLTSGASAVSSGLSFGGVVALIIGTVSYWSDMQDYIRLIILALALAALIWLGVKKIRD